MDIDEIARLARKFNSELDATKKRVAPTEFGWYPYGTLNNFQILRSLLKGGHRQLLDLVDGQPVVDIGAADGDTAFFMESLGCRADVVDYAPTNFNGCRGVAALKEAMQSGINIRQVDLDAYFELPGERYGLAFFLGILYHLKNPFGAMENLAKFARHALVSTRVARYNLAPNLPLGPDVNSIRVDLRSVPAAYLVDPYETNNDPTNYWMFSDAGLRRLFDRTGWDILDYTTVGNTKASDPATNAGDERAFCLLRSRRHA